MTAGVEGSKGDREMTRLSRRPIKRVSPSVKLVLMLILLHLSKLKRTTKRKKPCSENTARMALTGLPVPPRCLTDVSPDRRVYNLRSSMERNLEKADAQHNSSKLVKGKGLSFHWSDAEFELGLVPQVQVYVYTNSCTFGLYEPDKHETH